MQIFESQLFAMNPGCRIVEVAGPEDTTDGLMPTVVVFYGFDPAYPTAMNPLGFTEVEFLAIDFGRI